MKILLTGFEPFGGNERNISWNIVASAPQFEDCEIVKLRLPVSFKRASKFVIDAIKTEHPDVVLMFGQSKREGINVERVAINISDAAKPDNDGYVPVDEIIEKKGASAYFSTLPIKKIVVALQANGLDAKVSNSAGTYVCNCLCYEVLHYIQQNSLPILAGFIHISKEYHEKNIIPNLCNELKSLYL